MSENGLQTCSLDRIRNIKQHLHPGPDASVHNNYLSCYDAPLLDACVVSSPSVVSDKFVGFETSLNCFAKEGSTERDTGACARVALVKCSTIQLGKAMKAIWPKERS